MCDFEFCLPMNNESLLDPNPDTYYVRNLCIISSLKDNLKQAKTAQTYDGAEYILNHFDTYYSVLYHHEKIGFDLVERAINDLTKPLKTLCTYLKNLLDENEMPDMPDIRQKNLNILKMYMFLYTKILTLHESKVDEKNKHTLSLQTKGRKGVKNKKSDENDFTLEEKLTQFQIISDLLSLQIFKLWEPPVCEESFINLIADMCFQFLQNQTIKSQRELWENIFLIFGILLKQYSYSMTFTIRLTQMIKMTDHLESIIPEGIKILVDEYNTKSLVHEFLHEVIEWQSDETVQDLPAARNASLILTEMTRLMPELMLPEVVYLLNYLRCSSYTLRNTILAVCTEVIIKVLSVEGMSDEQKEIRNELLTKLKDHIIDINAHVRSKSLQHWTRLHSESAVPLDMQIEVLKIAMKRLNDKATLVRKNAIQLMTTFLKCNPYAATLDIDFFEMELLKEIHRLNELKPIDVPLDKQEDMTRKEREWAEMEDDVRKAIINNIEAEDESSASESTENDEAKEKPTEDEEISSDELERLIKAFLSTGKYKDAVTKCMLYCSRNIEISEKISSLETEDQIDFFVNYMHSVHSELNKNIAVVYDSELQRIANLTEEQITEIQTCEKSIKFFTDTVKFLKLIDSILPIMTELVNSSTVSDMHEAIEFFIIAQQFRIKNSSLGVSAMLTLMNSTEQDRKNAIIKAYGRIFLFYEGNPQQRAQTIISKLINLLKSINIIDMDPFTHIVQQWTANGDIDNQIIELLWNMFTGRVENASDDNSWAALTLLSMAACGRKTIVERNMNLITEMAFSKRGIDDPRLFITACKMLSIMGDDVIVVTKDKPCFRIDIEDSMWANLKQCVISIIESKSEFCCSVISAAAELIYKVSRQPEKLAEGLILAVQQKTTDMYYVACFCHLLGEIAARQFSFLDVIVYKELKRRNYIREERKRDKKQQKKRNEHDVSKASASSRIPATPTPGETGGKDEEESYLEGATADDTDAEFILAVCEREIVTQNLLGQYAPLLVRIVKHPHRFANEFLQATAVLALVRYMIVSSELCKSKNNNTNDILHLVMTVLEQSKYDMVKNNIIIGLADLLHRFPNLIDPWSPQLFKLVKNESESVRMTAVSTITVLIMEDMLRVKGTVADLSLCIVDKCSKIAKMTEEFFHALAKKGNTIYNVLPDVISRLSNDTKQVDEEIFQKVITFLILLLDKDRQIESFVEKLCLRFNMSTCTRVWRDIAFCLTLLNYNEKALLKLEENYPAYKSHLEDDVVYDLLLSVAQKYKNTTKDEIRNISRRLDHLIRTGESTPDESVVLNTSSVSSSAKKKPTTRGRKKRRT